MFKKLIYEYDGVEKVYKIVFVCISVLQTWNELPV